MNSSSRITAVAVFCAVFLAQTAKSDNESTILGDFSPNPKVSSTIPSNGDTNPYGVAFVPNFFFGGGTLLPGDVLVSNFNGPPPAAQGTGRTIVRITPTTSGTPATFFEGPTGLGLTTALGVLQGGFVLVGNAPNDALVNNKPAETSLIVLDHSGKQVTALSASDPKFATLLDGPWDLTINDFGFFAQIFVSNVLSGTVTRLDVVAAGGFFFHVLKATQIASGYTHGPNTAALVVGPTGLAYDRFRDVLYVASTGDNEIFSISHAGTTNADNGMGTPVYQDNNHLFGPLGLVLAPNGHLITSNGDAINNGTETASQFNQLVEFTTADQFVTSFQLDNTGTAGGAFGIAITGSGEHVRFAAVDDNNNNVTIWSVH